MPILPKKYRQYLGLGFEITASMAVPVCGGYFADKYFNSFPWCTLVGAGLGFVIFIATIIRISKKIANKDL